MGKIESLTFIFPFLKLKKKVYKLLDFNKKFLAYFKGLSLKQIKPTFLISESPTLKMKTLERRLTSLFLTLNLFYTFF